MAAMVGARRALLAARYSPRGVVASSAAPVPLYRRVDSPLSLPAERGCLLSLLPHRDAGSLASERTDDYHHELDTGSYRDPHSNHFNHKLQRDHPSVGSSTGVGRNRGVSVGGSANTRYGGNSEQPHGDPYSNHSNHKMQRDLPSVGSSTGVDRNWGLNVSGSANTRDGGNSEQPCGSGGSYGFPNSHQPYSSARVNNETPGYKARQPYGSSSAYNQQSFSGDLPNARQQYNGTEASNGLSGYGKGQTYDHPNEYDTYSSGYNTQTNQKIHKGEAATTGQYRYSPSGQSFPSSVGNDQQVFQQQKYVDHRSGGSYPDRPGNPASQYANPTGFHKEHVAGFQQGNNGSFGYIASQAYQSPYVTGKADTHSNHQGYSMNQNTDVQHHPHGIYQEKHSHIQPAASFGNHLNTAPHQDGISYQSPPGNLSNDGPPSELPNEITKYNQQSLSGDLPNACQQYNGTEASNGLSGYGKGQTYDHPNVYDTYSSGYNTQTNQKIHKGEAATTVQYRYGPSGQSFSSSVGNDQQVFQQQKYVNHRSGGSYPDRPGNPASQYANPTGFHKEHVAGFQQGNNSNFGYIASQAYQSPYVTGKADAHSNHQGYSMNQNADVQHRPHGIYQENHSHIQPAASFGNHLNTAPHQDGIYYQSPPGNPSNDGSPSEVPDEITKCKGTVEELEKLCEDGNVNEALEVLAMLQRKGTVVQAPQFFILMQACGDATALAEARVIHSQISESPLAADTDVQNKILEMYAKCCSMEDAKKLFSTMDHHNLTSWNTMISGFVHNGLGEEATDFFDQFKQTGEKPDPGMFKHILLACGTLGSVDEGMLHFESMQKDFGITPTMEHYASIVSMLGQSGYIAEAREFVERMPVEPSVDVWESLMNMCRLNGFLELGDRCAQIIVRLDSSRLNEQSKMGLFPVNASDLAKEKERKKASAAEARSKVHEYRAGDRSHPDTPKIYEELRYLAAHMKEAGYIADTRFVLHDVDQETKEDALLAHSERLAISYGLITSAARSPIRVIKNLRSCGDCHTAFKIISKLVGRLIIARDAKRFHHFENGVCSCKDYW